MVITFALFVPEFHSTHNTELQVLKANLVKKHLKRLKKLEGAIKLVGGREEYEGKNIISKKSVWLVNYFVKLCLHMSHFGSIIKALFSIAPKCTF